MILNPTLDVEVAEPEMFRPERVVVPKPTDETESCVAVDEPTTNPTVSPAIGLTPNRANGVDDEIPTFPVGPITNLLALFVASIIPNELEAIFALPNTSDVTIWKILLLPLPLLSLPPKLVNLTPL